MHQDLINIIFLYVDIDEFYTLKDEYKLCVGFYCKNVDKIPTGKEQSYIKFCDDVYTENEIDWASYTGYLEVVKYLHSIGKDCTTCAMDWASNNGHLEVIKYLHSIGKDCIFAMDNASAHGHLEVVKYLHSIGKDCTTDAMSEASKYGHFEVVKYLHSIGETPTNYAIRNAKTKKIRKYLEELKNKLIS